MKWDPLMDRALALAVHPLAPRGVNPRVGCVIVDESGQIVGEGWHAGAGTPHAEVVALLEAGDRAIGATAVVTLEPCRHHGRTGPCVRALIESGITRVVYAQPDPTDAAGGGAAELAAAGVEVVGGVRQAQAREINREWSIAAESGRPFVTAKCAISLDGRVAGHDGRPVALTGAEANRYTHRLRSHVQAVVVGTGTAVCDDPQLTIRHADIPVTGQPLRVVMGTRVLPGDLRVLDESAPSLQIRSHDPHAVLTELYGRGCRHVLLEGGPTVLRAFVECGLVNEFIWLVAGVWLGSGPRPLPDGARVDLATDVTETRALGQDVLVRMTIKSTVA